MSTSKFKIIAKEPSQPLTFNFNSQNLTKAKKIIKMYPSNFKESSIMPLLSMAQEQNHGWLPKKAIEYVSDFIEVPEIKVLEIATFYSMYNLSPVGKFHIEVCTTTPCMLRGAYDLVEVCKNKISKDENKISKDGKASWMEVECLGACVNAPMIQINMDYFEDLSPEKLEKIINQIKDNENPRPGSYKGRINTEPENIRKTLLGNKNA